MSTHATFLEKDYLNNFKLESKVILKVFDLAKNQPKSSKFRDIVPLFSLHIQREKNENVFEAE